jgi:hypothetical protein
MSGRTAEEWRKLLAEYHASGEGNGIFCQRHKVNVSTLYYWLSKEAKDNKPMPKLLPVIEQEAPSLDSVEITLPKGMTLRFSPGTSASYVAAIIKGLG